MNHIGKQATYRDFWLFIALLALICFSHEMAYQEQPEEKQQRVLDEYYYGN